LTAPLRCRLGCSRTQLVGRGAFGHAGKSGRARLGQFAIDEAELAELDDDERLDRIVELARQAEVLPPLMPMARVLR
jgi:hypothetical protein